MRVADVGPQHARRFKRGGIGFRTKGEISRPTSTAAINPHLLLTKPFSPSAERGMPIVGIKSLIRLSIFHIVDAEHLLLPSPVTSN